MIEKIIGFIITYILKFFWSEAEEWIKEYTDKKTREAINAENLKRYNEAIDQKLPIEERHSRMQDLINGTDRRANTKWFDRL